MAAPRELDLSDEVEGEQDGTTDFVFRLVGDPIPVLPTASSPLPLFDLHSPPARPLAVSNRHAAVFLAHPKGFIAARTKALIDASKEAREKGKASTRCAQDCCVADVPLPGVSLLALSRDESVLAACTGSEIKFFSVTSLLTDKDVEPSSSCILGQSGTVKDFKWLNHGYIALSNGGLLSQGSLGEGLKDVMENVDAVDCCKDGNHIAVVRENSLRILSSDLKETCCMVLLFQLWSESDSEGTIIKVDSIGWVRDDSIVVGCVRLDEVGNEEGYMVQVIRSGGDTFFKNSSKPVVFSYDCFGGIMDDILPSAVGPNLLLGYLHRWDLMVFSNKKSTDDHISLLKWPSITDDERTVVYLEILEDKYSPRIDLQENGDDNVILGFGVENVSLFQKITVLVGPEQKEVAPQHLLLCLTSEGKIIIYYLARISDPSDLPQTSLSTIEDSNVNKQISHATVSGKDLTPSVTSSMAKSLLVEPEAEPSSAQAERNQHGSRGSESISSVSRNKDVAGSSLPTSSDNMSLNTKQVNVASPFAPPSSSATSPFAPPSSSTPSPFAPPSSSAPSPFAPPSSSAPSPFAPPSSSAPSPFAPPSSSAPSPFAPPSSSAPTSNTKPGMPFSFSTANNAGPNSTGSKGSSELISSWQPNNSSSFVNSQLGKGGSDSAKPLGAFGGSQNSTKAGGSLSFKSPLFSSDGSVPVKTAERNEATGFGSNPAQTSYTSGRNVPVSSAGLSSAPSLPISPNKPVGSSSAGFGAGNREALPIPRGSTLPHQTIGMSHNNRTHTSADSRNFKLGTKFDTEQDLSKKFYSINDMTEELDTLLAYIEKDGGFRDACITFQQRPLSVLEGDLHNLLELSQVFKSKLEEQCSKADDLRNKMFQVSARQAYMKGILSQSSDTQYWDIWNRQKLSPEFEAKRQNILKANQNLTNQLVELERHFNNLEMNKFGETGRVTSSRTAVYSNKSRSSQTQLSSVYNALNSQLAAAEQLSECLSKQISALNISSSKKRGAVTKELFESIGLAHTADATQFSGGIPSKLNQRFPSTKEHAKAMLGPSKSAEPETARRRRESLDRSLASLEPQKTTVKRIAQQQRLKISSDLPFRSNKKMFDSQMAAISQETFSGSPSSSLVESYTSRLRSPTEVLDEKRKPSGPQHNSLFKWVNEPAGPSQGSEQKHLELPGRMKSADQSSKLVPSSPASFSYTQKDTRDRISSPSVASFGSTHTVPKSNTLTFKTTMTPKTNANTRPDMSPSVASSLPVKTFSGESAAGSTLTTKNRHSDQDVPSFGSMKGLGISPQNMGVNKPSLSSEPSKPAVLHGKTFQLSGVSDTMQNSAKASPQVAPQPHAFSPASQSSSFSIMSGASSLAASPLSTMQVSAAKTSDVSSSVSSIPPPQKSMSKISPTVSDGNISSSIPSIPTPLKESSPALNRNVSKSEVVASEVTGATVSLSATSTGVSTNESKTALLPVTSSSLPSNPPSMPKIVPGPTESAVIIPTRKDVRPSNLSSDEDEMEEESPSAGADLNLGALGGFGLGSATSSSPKKSNPFGSTFATSDSKSSGSPFTLTTNPGQLFRPASLSIPSSQPAQPSQSTSSSTFSSAFSSGLSGFGQPAQAGAGQQSGFGQSAQIGAGQQAGFGQPAQIQSGFGQPAQIGSAQQSGFGQPAQFGAQQALGSVLGSFGQSRQLGGFGGFASSSSSGAFTSAPSSNSGFAGAAAGGGFSAAASVGGGFAAAATGGGFASLASKSGGFGAAASSAGGFGGAAQGGGFGGAAQGGGFGGGGFGAFGGNSQGATGFSSFGASAASGPAGGPPADFLTQMRK